MDERFTEVLELLKKYRKLNLEQSIDWEKFNFYSIVHHSTSIEGASLTEEETQIFLDEGLTAKGKPMIHHLMQKDNYEALLFVLKAAEDKTTVVTVDFIRKIAALVMKSTGSVHNTALGSFDSAKGDLRLLNVHAGNTRFIDFTKVPELMEKFCTELNDLMKRVASEKETLIISFDAHFNLVSIHPFADGNGRVSRLLMNYIQHYYHLPLSIVYKEDKADYYKALIETRKDKNMDIFHSFMLDQYMKMIRLEVTKHEESQKEHIIKDKNQGFGMSMMF